MTGHVFRLDHEPARETAGQGISLREALRLDEAGIDRVHPDAAAAKLGGQRTGKCELRVLRRGIRPRRSERDGSRHRHDVDDVGAPRGLERRQERAYAPNAAEVVHAQ